MSTQKSFTRRDFVKIVSAGTIATTVSLPKVFIGAPQNAANDDEQAITVAAPRTLGRTGLKLFPLGFGAMRTSDPAVIRKAIDMGVNTIDTARVYMNGRNEEVVGQATSGVRDKVYILTKVKPKNFDDYDKMSSDVEKSLKALKTDYIDILLLHNMSRSSQIENENGKKLLTKLKEEGKIRFSGFSTHSGSDKLISASLKDKFYDVILVGYNFKSSNSLKSAIAEAAAAQIGIIAMKTQAGGYQDDIMGSLSPHPAALKWVLSDKNVSSTIPSMVTFDQLEENFTALEGNMGWMDRKTLHKYGQVIDKEFCRMCGACQGYCPDDVNISEINRCVMYSDAYKDYELAISNYNDIQKQAKLDKCVNCNQCSVSCTYGLDIQAKMNRAMDLFT